MFSQVDARFDHAHALGFEKLSLQGCEGLADKDLAVSAEDAMPGNSFAPRGGAHGAARSACAAWKTQNSSKGPIG